jgi:ERCC4-type nuclease
MGQTFRNALMPTITYNIPADKQADVLAALRGFYQVPNATAVELNTLVGNDLKDRIRRIYKDHMAKATTYDVSLD